METMYQLLALDLDGTLLDRSSRVTEQNARAVRRAQMAGVKIALCTGRHLADARLFSEQLLAPADWAVTVNGALVSRLDGSETVLSAGLDRRDCRTILEVCGRYASDPCFYTAERLYFGDGFNRFFDELRRRGHQMVSRQWDGAVYVKEMADWEALLEEKGLCFSKAILYHRDPSVVDGMTRALEATGRFELAPSVMYGGALKNVEVNRKGVHKGRGLERLAAHLGFSMRQVMAVGDSDNDLTMLRQAGLSVAMGNAPAHIRAAADAYTADHTENGVARAIERYLLEERI